MAVLPPTTQGVMNEIRNDKSTQKISRVRKIERPVSDEQATNVQWGSDVAADLLRELGIEYITINPGASFRGFHDSIVNHLGNHSAKNVAVLERGPCRFDCARLRQSYRQTDGLRAAQQCRTYARVDGNLQRLVRSNADHCDWRNRPS